MLDCIKALYSSTYSKIRVNDDLTSPITIDRGVKQGCTLSPILFNVYINDLIDCINRGEDGINFGDCKVTCLLYADDLVILGDTPTAVQSSLDTLSNWCKRNGMEVNPKKTKVVHFRHPRRVLCQTAFHCDGVPIEYTDCYKYLGVEFSEHLSWAKVIESTAIKANRAASYLIAKMKSSGAFMYSVYTHLYKTLILPIIEYSSFIYVGV